MLQAGGLAARKQMATPFRELRDFGQLKTFRRDSVASRPKPPCTGVNRGYCQREMSAQFAKNSSRPNARWLEGATPFRYPGGKAFLFDDLKRRIEAVQPTVTSYAEPYAGGAGAALRLLASQSVHKIYLNDFDWRIFCTWSAMINDAERFVDRILTTPLNVETWKELKDVVSSAEEDASDPFEVGFATFYLNRTNRSGIVVGAGPIGGYDQSGKWKIDARFPRDALAARVLWISQQGERIVLSNEDGLSFLKRMAGAAGEETFFFIDPPYVGAGSRLYMNAMTELLHLNLANFLIKNEDMQHWVVTYDDHSLIRSAYSAARIEELDVRYTLQSKRKAGELLITSSR